MEVHHSHHAAHKKKWNEYLLEFLMLFLAVFLGFLVENYREHQVEKSRTRNHMHTMIENLKYDTARYIRNVRVNVKNMLDFDSFRHEVNEAIIGRINANKLYYYYIKVGRQLIYGIPVLNDAAISQLKSSGLIRMIKDDNLVSEIGDYYSRRVANLEGVKAMVFARRDVLNETFKSVFSAKGFESIYQKDALWSPAVNMDKKLLDSIVMSTPSIKLLTTNPAQLERLYSDLADMEWILGTFDAVIRYNHRGADTLMKHIKTEYHFE